ncbi:MAG: SAM-dependent methyltransferase [Helicobacteraceae bacterium CG2_30_36_10]|nr:MAG: SAM-dependent methyltransferase [Helicobacteraceae bacterium CG2_30_36_10]
MKDHFNKKAETWDEGAMRVNGAAKIAEAINRRIPLNKEMEIMDFGTGTGLLGFEIAKATKKVYGVDTSPSMLEKLHEKNTPEMTIETYCQDIIKDPIDKVFHGMVSSMTLHHVEELELFFKTLHQNIAEGGFIAIADLESEDGTFHSDNTGVFHFGFEEKKLCEIVENAGFKDVKFENIDTINKPNRDFGVFLLTAKK